ncbi:DUF11 domain-containing protein, partial [Methanobrevibacter sp. OttesenSCG-928-K11]|nr:DUF11 domain-containing protein [Methanobrevibacter sp. OttesenSCG-928-K11]
GSDKFRNITILFTLTLSDYKFEDQVTLSNRAIIEWSFTDNSYLDTQSAAFLVINQPDLTITKDVNVSIIENQTKAGYSITIVNSGHGNAYNVIITDDFKEKYGSLGSINDVYIIWGNGTRYNLNDTEISNLFDTRSGFNIGCLYGVSEEGVHNPRNFTLYYTVIYNAEAVPNQIIKNTASIKEFYSTPTSTNNYVDIPENYKDDAQVKADTLSFTKEYWKSNKTGNKEITIGETGIFNLTITLPQLITEDLTIKDTLPAGLEYIGYKIVSNIGAITNPTVTPNGQEITFKFSNSLIALSDVNNTFTLLLYFRVVDNQVNNPSHKHNQKINTADLSWKDGSSIRKTANVNIYEPDLEIIKKFDKENITGGENTTVTIDIKNIGEYTAYNITVIDDLREFLNNGFVYVSNSLNAPGSISSEFNGTHIIVKYNSLSPTANSKITFNLTSNEIVVGILYNNTVYVNYTSLPIDNTNNEIRTYLNSSTALLNSEGGNLTKIIISSDNVTIGDKIVYNINVTLPMGIYDNLIITDYFPEGFSFDGFTNTAAENIDFGNFVYTVLSNSITFKFEGETKVHSNTGNSFIFTLTFTVSNHSSNKKGNLKTNIVNMTWDELNKNFTDSAIATIVEPDILITKSFSKDNITGGDTFNMTIVIENIGDSTAFNITVIDDLNQFLGKGFKIDHIIAGGSVYNNINLNILTVYYNSLAAGANYTITVVLSTYDIVIGTVYNNTAYVNYTSLPTGPIYRDYENNSNIVYLNTYEGSISKFIVKSSNVTIGEVITYEILLNLPQGIYYNLTIKDILPIGFEYNSGEYVIVNDSHVRYIFDDFNITINKLDHSMNVTFTFKGIVNITSNNAVFSIKFNATILNHPSNYNRALKINHVDVTWEDSKKTHEDNAIANIVEPKVVINKSFSKDNVTGGDTFNMTIVIENIGDSTAFNITVFDNLSEFLTKGFKVDSIIADGSVYRNIDSNMLKIYYNSLSIDASYTITVVLSSYDVIIGKVYNNTAYVNYTSFPVDENSKKNESNSGIVYLNTYEGDISKIIVNTTVNNDNKHVTIGEVITYEILLNLPQGVYYNLTIKDKLPGGFKYNSGEYVIVNDSNIRFNYDDFNISIDSLNNIITFKFKGIVNITSNNAKFSIKLNATILNDPSNINGTLKTNYVNMTWEDSKKTHEDNVIAIIIEPDISISKKVNTSSANHNDILEYEIIIKNNGSSTAFNINLTDTLPDGLIFIEGEIINPKDGWNYFYNETSRILTITGDNLTINSNITFVFKVKVDPSNIDILGKNITNVGSVIFSSINGTENRTYPPKSANATTYIYLSDIVVTKKNITEIIAGENV